MYQLLVHDPRHELPAVDVGRLRLTVTHDPDALLAALCRSEWDAIVTFGAKDWRVLETLPYFLRRRWVHLDEAPTGPTLVATCEAVYRGYTRPETDAAPLVSITTPTWNSAAFIRETAAAVLAQTWDNWEWVIVDDGSTDDTVAIVESLRDPRIRVFPMRKIGRIGFLKNAATSLARGAFLLELDHDDLLLPRAAERVVQAFAAAPDAGMVYSNFAEWWSGTDRFHRYEAPFWRYRHTPWNGMLASEALGLDVMGTFEPDGRAEPVICWMNVCPNHLRAFRASTLRRIGGYRNLVWADDYDVMIRMFLDGPIHHIDEMLYVQRMGTNTWTSNASLLWPSFAEVRSHHEQPLRARLASLGLPVLF